MFDLFCAWDIDDQTIIVKEFFPRADIAQGLDENAAAAVFERGAIWSAGMIDPLRFVSPDRRIDDFFFVIESEIICTQVVQVIRNIRPQNTASGIFDDARAFADRSGRKNTAAVHRRFADLQMFSDAILRSGVARPCSFLPLLLLGHLRLKMGVGRRNANRLFCFAPDDVFVVSPVDQGVDFAVGAVVEKDPAFDVFPEKDVARFGKQFFFFAFAFDE